MYVCPSPLHVGMVYKDFTNGACVAPNAPAAEQTEAHANHVSCVRFSPDEGGNAWLVSTGGKDRGALQWRVAGGTETDEETLEGGDAGSPASRTTAAVATCASMCANRLALERGHCVGEDVGCLVMSLLKSGVLPSVSASRDEK